jgi:hypothetical protein
MRSRPKGVVLPRVVLTGCGADDGSFKMATNVFTWSTLAATSCLITSGSRFMAGCGGGTRADDSASAISAGGGELSTCSILNVNEEVHWFFVK